MLTVNILWATDDINEKHDDHYYFRDLISDSVETYDPIYGGISLHEEFADHRLSKLELRFDKIDDPEVAFDIANAIVDEAKHKYYRYIDELIEERGE